MYKKEIVYDRTTRDYAMYLDGELVGFARTYHEAEVTLDQLVFELMSGLYYREQAAPAPAEPVHAACQVCGKTLVEDGLTHCRTCKAEIALDAAQIDPPTTCVFCSGLHHPQSCPDMRALLFAPDAPIICSIPDNLCDVHDPCPAHAADAARYLAEQAMTDLHADHIYLPYDVDFAPFGQEV